MQNLLSKKFAETHHNPHDQSKEIAMKYLISVLIFLFGIALPAYSGNPDDLNISQIAKDVTKNVGKVGRIYTTGKKGPVFVFEEFHTSRVGQLQAAIMLVRLHDKYGLKIIGLEGAIKSPNYLDTGWFHSIGGEKEESTKQDVAVRMLAEGEISQAEFMALAFPDVKVYGIESGSEYEVKLDVKDSPQLKYLFEIAKQKLTQSQINQANSLANKGKIDQALEYIMSRDPWVNKMYKTISKPSDTSTEAMVNQIREIQDKASSMGVSVDSKTSEDMTRLWHFWPLGKARNISDLDVNSVIAACRTPTTTCSYLF